MANDDLQELLVPQQARDRLDLSSPVSRVLVLVTGTVGVAGCVLMWWGAGGPVTWLGAVVYIVFLVGFTLISTHGVERQSDRLEKAIRESQEEGSS